MNRYLIVVFCVLTGCAAVPVGDFQEFSIDQQLLSEWYADHVLNIDESYSSPILVPVEQDHFSGNCFSNPEEFSPLKNLPKLLLACQSDQKITIHPLEGCSWYFGYRTLFHKAVPDGDFHIRAPVIS